MGICIVIPARARSSRLDRKLLLRETGKPLIQYSWEAASRTKYGNQVFIATDDDEIEEVSKGFGAKVIRTGNHCCGTTRVAEAIKEISLAEVVVNLQADEVMIRPNVIERVVDLFIYGDSDTVSTAVGPLVPEDETDQDIVKAIIGEGGEWKDCYWFTRIIRPHHSNASRSHVGIYCFDRWQLDQLLNLEKYGKIPSRLMKSESLEQMAFFECGWKIIAHDCPTRSLSINTQKDYDCFRELLRASGR